MVGTRLRRTFVLGVVALVGAAPLAGASLINVNPVGEASDGDVSAAGYGNATADCIDVLLGCAPGVAVAFVGNAEGGVAATYAGYANSSYASISVLSPANSEGIAVSGQGNATGMLLAASVLGDARCATWGFCFAVSLTGNATTLGGCTVLRSAGLSAWCGSRAADQALSLLG